MSDFADHLKEKFDLAMLHRLDAYRVLPDEKSIEYSAEDNTAIDIFEILLATVDAIPPSLIETADELRTTEPDRFEHILQGGLASVGYGFSPDSATEFVEVLNRTVHRDMAST
jgi:hypothetical protein